MAKRSAPKKPAKSAAAKKAASKPKAKAKPASAGLGASQAQSADVRRRLFRRDSDEQVKRIITDRLVPEYGAARIHGARTEDGVDIEQWLKQRIKESMVTNKYVPSGVISEAIAAFNLRGSPFELPDFSPCDDIDDELQEALSIARHSNPALRRTLPVEKYFEYLDTVPPLNVLLGFVQCIQEDETVVRSHSVCMMWSFLKYIARIFTSICNSCFFRCFATISKRCLTIIQTLLRTNPNVA
jgi:hypothetical protein